MVWYNLQENPTHRGFGSTRKLVQRKASQAASTVEDDEIKLLCVWEYVFQNTLHFSTADRDCYQESHNEM